MKIFDRLHGFFWQSLSTNNCNAYLIEGTKKILIDPGHHHLFGHVKNGLAALSLSFQDINLVLITHAHPDHMEALRAFKGSSTRVAMGVAEMEFIRQIGSGYGSMLGIPDFEPDFLLTEGELNAGNVTLEIFQTPGHSPGSLCLYWQEKRALFTGDVIFNRGVGRTDLPGGSGSQLKESIRRLSQLEVDYLLPGHGEAVSDRESVKANFDEIERTWFGYL